MSRFNPIAILAGIAVDFVSSFGAGIALTAIAVVLNYSADEPFLNEVIAWRQTTVVRIFGLVGTTLSTALGGFAAATLSRGHGISNAIAVGVIVVGLGLVLAVLTPGVSPLWKIVAGTVLTIPAAWLGAVIANGVGLNKETDACKIA